MSIEILSTYDRGAGAPRVGNRTLSIMWAVSGDNFHNCARKILLKI